MKITKLDALQNHIDKKLIKSKVSFDYVNSNTATFQISNNNKNVSGRITLNNQKVSFEEISSNYSRNYLGTVLNNAISDSGLELNVTFRSFSVGDILYLESNQTNQHQISNFSYYGFNTHTDCVERKCFQKLDVAYLGINQILCGGTNPYNYAKYRVTNII